MSSKHLTGSEEILKELQGLEPITKDSLISLLQSIISLRENQSNLDT